MVRYGLVHLVVAVVEKVAGAEALVEGPLDALADERLGQDSDGFVSRHCLLTLLRVPQAALSGQCSADRLAGQQRGDVDDDCGRP